jgi:hypothetical protein
MPVRRRLLARQDHLVGADQRARRLEIGALRRVAHHQVAALGERHVDQAAGGVEPGLGVLPAPMRRHEFRLRLRPQDRLLARHPSRREADAGGLLVERVQRGDIAYRGALGDGGNG